MSVNVTIEVRLGPETALVVSELTQVMREVLSGQGDMRRHLEDLTEEVCAMRMEAGAREQRWERLLAKLRRDGALREDADELTVAPAGPNGSDPGRARVPPSASEPASGGQAAGPSISAVSQEAGKMDVGVPPLPPAPPLRAPAAVPTAAAPPPVPPSAPRPRPSPVAPAVPPLKPATRPRFTLPPLPSDASETAAPPPVSKGDVMARVATAAQRLQQTSSAQAQDVTLDVVRQWAGPRGIVVTGAHDVAAVNARRRSLGLHPFNLISGRRAQEGG
jgi:hypothetical protein